MAKTKGYDVWLTATNRVYRAVPYDVVADWLQQGRVVGDDRIRPEGGARGEGGRPVYSLGQGDRPPDDAERDLTLGQVLARLDARIKAIGSGPGVAVRVAAHKQTPFGTIQALTAELEKRRGAGRIS